MHETHLIEPIIKGINEHAKRESRISAVTKVRLNIGVLNGIKENSLRATFLVLAKDTLLENAELEISYSPGSKVEVISFDVE